MMLEYLNFSCPVQFRSPPEVSFAEQAGVVSEVGRDKEFARLALSRVAAGCGLLNEVVKRMQHGNDCAPVKTTSDVWKHFRGSRWTSSSEACFLYLLARHSSGIVVEQGPWLGASTIALARGLKDSADPTARPFFSVDAFPLHINATEEERISYGNYWKLERWSDSMRIGRPNGIFSEGEAFAAFYIDGERVGGIPVPEYLRDAAPFIEGAGGQMQTLLTNLRAAGVSDAVAVMSGLLIPGGFPYAVTWSDATHNMEELRTNVPRLLDANSQTHIAWQKIHDVNCFTLAFHDIFA